MQEELAQLLKSFCGFHKLVLITLEILMVISKHLLSNSVKRNS